MGRRSGKDEASRVHLDICSRLLCIGRPLRHSLASAEAAEAACGHKPQLVSGPDRRLPDRFHWRHISRDVLVRAASAVEDCQRAYPK